ncbi:DUF4265 domain-containing protein [Pseudovibrio sp. Tun.PSC04-5.I4]|uniref:DUF4265 domain-containing protein n=1 Tax=Pseudovibrio sp. Tun.PSC04-5.I4 TaxID=1798213 RepID=UPI000884B1B1|nr:DUF4265 domain-containing protein [Pseudovibrio sp. Tun.PSC04-5.I4]SDR17589.1 protein of unknown function [Pseudovibrio sp. Tun.PSC04-5.I4]
MNTKSNLHKLVFKLDPHDWHGIGSETVWVRALGGNRYQLENTPFFADGVANGDELLAERESGQLVFDKVAKPSGHSTYRIMVEDSTQAEEFARQWDKLEKIGCTCEDIDADPPLFSVDVPTATDIHKTYAILEEGEGLGIWAFEEGHCGHKI